MSDWPEQVTAIATAVLAIGAVGAIGAAVFAAQQVREARIGCEAEVASEFFRRWSDDSMVATRRLVDRYDLWAPSIDAIGGTAVYPMFTRLAEKMRVTASR
jgi:hypothetical protein